MSNTPSEGPAHNVNPENAELSAERIGAALRTRWLGRPCYSLQETDSTNSVLAELAAEGAPAGTLVLAEFQSAGRGRQGRRWDAPPGSSLLFSLLFRPSWPAARAPWLTMIAGLAAVQAIRDQTGLRAALKWPNDVMVQVGGKWRKAGGILLETALDGDTIRHAILGIGLNVNVEQGELPDAPTPATSLLVAGGLPVARLPLLAALLLRLEATYEATVVGRSPQPDWDALLVTRGRPVRVRGHELELEGIATGTDEWGRLLVQDAGGTIHAVAAGDVTLREEDE
ncbi:MAG: biotin--[acetyl-CoA-carboxylase] ligase [Chloroflexi bacterium]|nr:biotin--[acetyl-CoA-carboxylase] ligase [Chloroflexota bacterium]